MSVELMTKFSDLANDYSNAINANTGDRMAKAQIILASIANQADKLLDAADVNLKHVLYVVGICLERCEHITNNVDVVGADRLAEEIGEVAVGFSSQRP